MRKIRIITALHERGPRDKRMGAGPLYLLEHNLPEKLAAENPDISFDLIEINSIDEPSGDWKSVLKISDDVKHAVSTALEDDCFPLVLGSGCLTSIGVVAALGPVEKTKILWFDRHGDLNTPETSTSGNMEGMPLALLTGRFGHDVWHPLTDGNVVIPFENVVLVGAADLDPAEADIVNGTSMLRIPMDAVRRSYEKAVVADDLFQSRLRGDYRLYIHLDVDALGSAYVPDTMSPVEHGLSVRQVGHVLRSIPEINFGALTVTGIIPTPDSTSTSANSIVSILNSVLRRIAA